MREERERRKEGGGMKDIEGRREVRKEKRDVLEKGKTIKQKKSKKQNVNNRLLSERSRYRIQ